jgi:ribonuclease D
MRPLTKDMLDYAALDTMYLLELRDRLKGELEERGRWGWAAEEFARLEGTQWAPEEDGTAFLRIKGARDLNRRELALLRELAQWRDGVARELDRSTFRVVSNDVLLEIARQAPTTRETLGAIKGMPRGVVENRGQEVLGCVRAGQAVPDADLPRFPKAPRYERDPEFDDKVARLKAVRDAAAARLELDPGVLCSRDRIEAVVRRNPRTLDELLEVPGMRRWQAAEIGDGFIRALEKPVAGAGTPTIAQALTQAAHANPNTRAALSSSATSENDSPYKD